MGRPDIALVPAVISMPIALRVWPCDPWMLGFPLLSSRLERPPRHYAPRLDGSPRPDDMASPHRSPRRSKGTLTSKILQR